MLRCCCNNAAPSSQGLHSTNQHGSRRRRRRRRRRLRRARILVPDTTSEDHSWGRRGGGWRRRRTVGRCRRSWRRQWRRSSRGAFGGAERVARARRGRSHFKVASCLTASRGSVRCSATAPHVVVKRSPTEDGALPFNSPTIVAKTPAQWSEDARSRQPAAPAETAGLLHDERGGKGREGGREGGREVWWEGERRRGTGCHCHGFRGVICNGFYF